MNSEKYSSHDAHRDALLVLTEFCIEVFDGGKCQRQHYFTLSLE